MCRELGDRIGYCISSVSADLEIPDVVAFGYQMSFATMDDSPKPFFSKITLE